VSPQARGLLAHLEVAEAHNPDRFALLQGGGDHRNDGLDRLAACPRGERRLRLHDRDEIGLRHGSLV
jgi:hypothetical protein